ncbi:MAG: hypothetical protein IKH85_07635 [Methanobrevibacter sp.]|uniref:hypothetical protein n=1 Tax=Methanobrevibacter sp. TaxID=66852 RepID=UPI0025D38A83|nr:hypothetical protein [Methanobrevibacter sp.]MBR6993930.1 hypothetical protein [Methanobrevibacter sp.]
MDSKIINIYTERLNMSSFKNSFDEDNIESLAKFNTSVIPQKQENLYTFLIEFTLRAVNNPISLDWVGVVILEYAGDEKLTEDSLLEDENIKGFINESLEKISFLLGGKLPNIVDEIKRKND